MAVVRVGSRGSQRVQIRNSRQIAKTIKRAKEADAHRLWLLERDWFAATLSPDELGRLERTLATVAENHEMIFRAWTANERPVRTGVYGVVEGDPTSPDPALDRPGE